MKSLPTFEPAILAPAGNKASFLAAVAAGADAIYCGMKQFSARMAAQNFTLDELALLTKLAHSRGIRVYIAFNTVIKPDELNNAAAMLLQLKETVEPDALIVQDLAMVELARRVKIKSELHLSTLANVSFPKALNCIAKIRNVRSIVLPRELNVDEIKAMAAACPAGIGLEVFVHGALCYGVSGRCYWSSYMGGKSGLRGRCVQPCRRRYRAGGAEKRFFSCQDLSLDVLVKVLLSVPEIKAWKIEGRKKGPHYVFYAVSAYKLLRDHGRKPDQKKAALEMLSMALGRVSTHYGFLPQRPQNPIRADDHTGSGRLMGYLQGPRDRPFLISREALLPGDVLRVGYEDDAWHIVNKLNQHVPAKGRMVFRIDTRKHRVKGTPVFLIDRQEPQLKAMLEALENEMQGMAVSGRRTDATPVRLPRYNRKLPAPFDLRVYRTLTPVSGGGAVGIWLSKEILNFCSNKRAAGLWWWLPPVIWPADEDKQAALIETVEKKGGRNFVLNAPWQMGLLNGRKNLNVWAGPFCNLTSGLALEPLKSLGFSGAMVSPELGQKDFLNLPAQSPLPLGIVLFGNWPLCISRTLSKQMDLDTPFVSPRGESAWVSKHGSNYWIYPNWLLDTTKKRELLLQAGYRCFVHLMEPVPKSVAMKKRPGLWNWKVGMR